MRAALLLLVSAAALFGWNPQEDENVNSRYTVESVNIPARFAARIHRDLRQELDSVVGKKLDHSVLNRLAARLRAELQVQSVSVRVQRGKLPDYVRVEFEVQSGRRHGFDIDIPKMAYHSRLGWTGSGQATTTFGNTTVAFGLVSDGDKLTERFAGMRASVEHAPAGSRRVRVKFEYDRYGTDWNPATTTALERDPRSAALYRSRGAVVPSVAFVLLDGLTLHLGGDLEQLEPQAPGARTESANTAVGTLRFQRQWEDRGAGTQAVDAAYTVRSASRAFGSDYRYSRHTAHVRYEWSLGRNDVTLDFMTGGITGLAPLFERLVLGNASTLRGWNKYDLDPLGGDRVVHGSVDYRYRFLTVFYDTGVVWSGPVSSGQKHAAGCGFRTEGKEGFLLAVAFPIRSGHLDPVLIAGFNF